MDVVLIRRRRVYEIVLVAATLFIVSSGCSASEIKMLMKKGYESGSIAQYDQALSYYEKALSLSREKRDRISEGVILNNIGRLHDNLAQYDKSLEYFEKALHIRRETGNIEGEGTTLNNIGLVYFHRGRFSKALEYYEQALAIRKKINDRSGEGTTLNNIGAVYSAVGQYSRALEYHEQAFAISRETGDVDVVGSILNNMGRVYNALGQYGRALENYEASLAITRKTDNHRGQGVILHNMGIIFAQLGQYSRALEYYEQALSISRKIRNVASEVGVLSSIGNIHTYRGQYNKALEYYEQALFISRKIGYVAGEGTILHNIASVNHYRGQYSKSLEYYKQALSVRKRTGDVAGEALTINNIGLFHFNLGQYSRALEYYEQALSVWENIGDIAGKSITLHNIGLVYDELGQYNSSLEYYEEALLINRKIGTKTVEGTTLNSLGTLHDNLGQYSKALNYYEQALSISRETGYVADEAVTLMNMALLYFKLNQNDKAVSSLKESIVILEQIIRPETAWAAYRFMGMFLRKSGMLKEAINYYRKAIDTIEKIYSSTKGLKEEVRSSMIGEKKHVHKEFIELLLELHRKNPEKGFGREAFMISEKAKSRVFQELMAKAGAETVLSGDETFKKLAEKQRQLLAESSNLQQMLRAELSTRVERRNEEVMTSLKEELSKVEKALQDIDKEIEGKFPRYADLKKPKPLTVEEFQNILKGDETLLAYAVGEEKTAAFVIRKETYKVIEIETGGKELSELIVQLRKGIDNVSELKDLERFRPEAAYALYEKMFKPVREELKGIKKLYISADDLLYTVPFEAFIDREVNREKFREARKSGKKGVGQYLGEYSTVHYLIDSYEITYLPSASVLRSLRKYEKPGYGQWKKSLVAFADPVFSPDETRKKGEEGIKSKGTQFKVMNKETEMSLQILTRSTGTEALPRLYESSEEAEAVSKEVKGRREDIYLRRNASEGNLHKADLGNARYLLFSTHGLLGGDFPGVAEPSLALTLIDNPPGVDGFLNMNEALWLDLNAELTILSACNTYGQGEKAGKGEGFAGLARSFMYAGSKSLLVTHWNVESRAATDVMISTFKEMKEHGKPDALRRAKLKIKSSGRQIREGSEQQLSLSHPFFWAPFVIVGEGK